MKENLHSVKLGNTKEKSILQQVVILVKFISRLLCPILFWKLMQKLKFLLIQKVTDIAAR